MTAFTGAVPGTSESRWAASRRLADLSAVPVPGRDRRVVVLAAHPDDETLGAGGLIAAAAESGLRIDVIVASDGAASHPDSPTHSPAELARIRAEEVRAATSMLAPNARLHLLALADGNLAAHGTEIRQALRELADAQTLLVSTWRGDRHPDHEACGRAAADIAAELGLALWEFPIWAWHWAEPDEAGDPAGTESSADRLPWSDLRRLELPVAAQQVKARAMAAYTSQSRPLSDQPGDEPVVPDTMLAHFRRDFETFAITAPAADRAYFDRLYAGTDDPWGLAERLYEQRKRAITLASLPRDRFARAFEPGCATGLFTVELARRCGDVVAWDSADRAVELTRQRLGAAELDAQVDTGVVPEQWPAGTFDLLFFSEVGYFVADLDFLTRRIDACLAPDGVVLACHWRHPGVENPHTTDAVHAAIGAGLALLVDHREDDFLLQVWSRSGQSVAAVEGIVT